MAAFGASVLEEFVTPGALTHLIDELEPHLAQAFFKPKTHNPYLLADEPAFAADHPRNTKVSTTSATLSYEHVPKDGVLETIYRSGDLRRFIADVMGYGELYPNADAQSPLNALIYQAGAETGWHFDNAHFVTTLMLRPAESGGAYEYAPFIRGDEGENFEQVAEVLSEASGSVKELLQPPGALVIFAGSRTLHRVTPVDGAKARLIAVLSYAPEPGFELAAQTRETFYGYAL